MNNLVDMYHHSVGRNATLILGLTPDNRGLLPSADVARLKEFGDEIKRRFSDPLASTSGKGNVYILDFKKPISINQLVIQEDISQGHRVKSFEIRSLSNDQWKTIVKDSSIGNKYIRVLNQPIISSKLQLVVTDSFDEPLIKKFEAYYYVPVKF